MINLAAKTIPASPMAVKADSQSPAVPAENPATGFQAALAALLGDQAQAQPQEQEKEKEKEQDIQSLPEMPASIQAIAGQLLAQSIAVPNQPNQPNQPETPQFRIQEPVAGLKRLADGKIMTSAKQDVMSNHEMPVSSNAVTATMDNLDLETVSAEIFEVPLKADLSAESQSNPTSAVQFQQCLESLTANPLKAPVVSKPENTDAKPIAAQDQPNQTELPGVTIENADPSTEADEPKHQEQGNSSDQPAKSGQTGTAANLNSALGTAKMSAAEFAAIHTTKIESNTADGSRIVHQIVESANFSIKGEDQVIVIKLKPDHFGEVQISLSKDEAGLTASIQTDNPVTRHLLASQIGHLQDALQEKGLNLNQINVNLINSQSGSQSSFDTSQSRQQNLYQEQPERLPTSSPLVNKEKTRTETQTTHWIRDSRINRLA